MDTAELSDQQWNDILNAAIAAPSADNSQPWIFRKNKNSLDIWIDKERSGGPSDKSFLLSDISVGAVIENIECAARINHLEIQITLFPTGENEQPYHVAKLEFTPTKNPTASAVTLETINARHTDRSFPWKKPLTETQKQELSAVVAQIGGCELLWLDKYQKKAALNLLWQTESLRFAVKELHSELFSSIRFDTDWKTSVTEGLAPASLNVEPPARPIFKACRNWNLMKTLNLLGAARGFGFRSAVLPNLLTPDIAVLTITTNTRKSAISGGRALERFWLTATEFQLAVQPFASPGVICLSRGLPIPTTRLSELQTLLHGISQHKGYSIVFIRVGNAHRELPRFTLRRTIPVIS